MRKGTSRLSMALGVVLVLALAVVGFVSRPADSQANSSAVKISEAVLQATENGQQTSFIVYMEDQADLSAASRIRDDDARGWYVYNTLKAQAERTQAPLRTQLDAQGISYQSFCGLNMIVVNGGRDLVEAAASRSDVGAIESNAAVDGLDGEDGPESTDEGNEVTAIETGLNNVKAPSIWQLGFTGQGMVVANQDTGMRWTHASLRNHYRGQLSGTTADHNYNWHDSVHARITNADGGTPSPANNSCGYNLVAPCDDQGHGTHTTGTTVGD